MSQTAILHCQQLGKTYTEGPNDVEVLKSINLHIEPSERIAIVGQSGSGKSTLLHLLGGLDLPTTGSVWIDGQEMSGLSDRKRGLIRNQYLGFVYQFHHLLPEFTALENVAMPLLIRGVDAREAKQKAAVLLDEIGLGHRLEHRPVELSGGERQRAAIARALVTEPALVLADEPTGNLDEATAMNVFEMMMELNARVGTALVMVTHDVKLANKMDTVLHLELGKIS
ncbi:lipoprotein-releasing system ATP-binding protein LolD [Arenicella chitinivorans]|uniref:Lipoprotein-releasing system ATP-binding protein LolD n=1 Tax=Arenicella chitinivorans TaxID=1329800 RepID=A0A918RY76_9GAMM|nr:lipoprotein-releasing ABC transporter ATP-binding protein LolD [Arenicella chitinivorans]GHA15593.1 lipoprotein-releasing system ATP-binding protein LolD [Arenicella chitinivorans]